MSIHSAERERYVERDAGSFARKVSSFDLELDMSMSRMESAQNEWSSMRGEEQRKRATCSCGAHAAAHMLNLCGDVRRCGDCVCHLHGGFNDL